MDINFEYLKPDSVKDMFVKKIEELIISGKLEIGERMPPEREIAFKMGISRTIVHSGIIELAAKGFLTIHPRKGTVVNDYRREGTLAVLNSLMNYSEGDMDEGLLESIISTRYLIEVENAGLAAANRSKEDLDMLKDIIEREEYAHLKDTGESADLDFEFHHTISIATGNMIYSLIIKSFEPVYKNLTSRFFKTKSVIPKVIEFHRKLYNAIEGKNPAEASNIMRMMLEHGEAVFRSVI